ncbi:MAG TPA: DUF167 domain-containing protein [Candidatus Limnocylindria bacterium]|nr:DUF167 domain-containing protein [Candidatus Limnocylindria bacterium]
MARRIRITVKPQAKKPDVTKITDSEYQVAVTAPARDGKANLELIEVLAGHFNLPQSTIKILRGHSARHKLIEIRE